MLAALKSSIQAPLWLTLNGQLKRPLVQFALLLALGLAVLPGSQAQADESQISAAPSNDSKATVLAQVSASSTPVFPEAGRYLFGQVPQRDVLGQGYIMLETTGDQVYGALYYPSSSFDCFQGQVQSGQLAMTITNSYTQEAYPYSIALVSDTAVATAASGALEPLNLQGFYQIDDVSDNDLHLLATCRSAMNLEI